MKHVLLERGNVYIRCKWAVKMARQVEMLVSRPDDWGSIPGSL